MDGARNKMVEEDITYSNQGIITTKGIGQIKEPIPYIKDPRKITGGSGNALIFVSIAPLIMLMFCFLLYK